MKILRYILVFCFLYSMIPVQADTYWVAFTDKHGTIGTLDAPQDYLSARAIERRAKQGIAIDSLDLPVSVVYRDSILRLGGQFIHQSRWHNGITIEVDDNVIDRIRSCSFVRYVERTQSQGQALRKPKFAAERKQINAATSFSANSAFTNSLESDVFTHMIRLDSLHNRGYRGAGMQIAVVDNGFHGVNQLAAFADVDIIDTKDFVQAGGNVFAQGEHGTMVLSTIAANVCNEYEGTATEAGFYLLRSEDDYSESIREVDAMVAAFEWADSVGADIITSSLGYYYFDDATTDYTYAMHDGKTLRNSIAATISARKGMLVCISAGNEGNDAWHYISSPSDADSILAVGAVQSNGWHSAFSSYGPTADGRVKPEICTMGSVVPLYNPIGLLTRSNGTSFSCPIAAGMAACLWSAIPELTNMEVRERILRFASQSNQPDNMLGYGIPNAWESYLGYETKDVIIPAGTIDWNKAAIYDLYGRYVGVDTARLPHGVYIQRKGKYSRKLVL